ncbi:hypothetical protein MTsN4n12_29250 [Microbacterium sp. MTN4-12]
MSRPELSSCSKRMVIVSEASSGGLASAAVRDATLADRLGFETFLVRPHGEAQMNSVPSSVKDIRLDFPTRTLSLRESFKLRAQLRAFDSGSSTWFHCHGLKSLAMVVPHRRLIVTYHGARGLPGASRLTEAVRLLALRCAPLLSQRAFTVVPLSMKGWRDVWIPSPNLPMTLDSRNYRDGLRLIWISRISPQKRFDLFLRVLRKLHSEGVLDSATAVGPIEPSLESEVNRMAEGLPLDILGERSDVSQFLAEDSVFCLFSHFEGRPFALEEAVASGLPVIASDLPGNRMIVGSEWLADDVDGAVELARRLQTPRTRGLVGRELKDRYERRRRDHEHDERAISDLYSRILVKGQVS